MIQRAQVRIGDVRAQAYRVPTDAPEADGTLAWDSTTCVVVELTAGGVTGLGYTYADEAAATLIRGKLAEVVRGRDAFAIPGANAAMVAAVRNLGCRGIAALAISAIDAALWDAKAKLLGLPLVDLIGAARDAVPVYGSGGFTSYDDERLAGQLAGWAERGLTMVKMKVGTRPDDDPRRVELARRAVGDRVALFVDGNGAYDVAQALGLAERFAACDVRWFEEPRPSDDAAGLAAVRARAPRGMAIAAGEYSWMPDQARALAEAGAVDVMQVDATRCCGLSGALAVADLCAASALPLSTHCAPALHAPLACARANVVHCEWFHDHVRLERMLFDGAPEPDAHGLLRCDRSRPGLGLDLKRADARAYAL